MDLIYREKFTASYTEDPSTGCWDWHGPVFNGNPVFYDRGQRTVQSRRGAWLMRYGEEPPWPLSGGCGRALCVAPGHSFPDQVYAPEHFWGRLDWSDPDGCWEWNRGFGGPRRNYGYVFLDGVRWRTHRLAWTLTHGTIPDGLIIRHLCNNPKCCRPAHLALGTHKMNADDREAAGRTVKGEEWHRRHGLGRFLGGLSTDELDTFRRDAVALTLKQCAEKYGVCEATAHAYFKRLGIKKRHPRSGRTVHSKITQAQADEIRRRLLAGECLLKDIHREYGISIALASKIKLGKAWPPTPLAA